MGPFTFEKLNVYQKALRWVKVVDDLCQAAQGRISPHTLDQAESYEKCRESLSELGRMLSGLIKAVEKVGIARAQVKSGSVRAQNG